MLKRIHVIENIRNITFIIIKILNLKRNIKTKYLKRIYERNK